MKATLEQGKLYRKLIKQIGFENNYVNLSVKLDIVICGDFVVINVVYYHNECNFTSDDNVVIIEMNELNRYARKRLFG